MTAATATPNVLTTTDTRVLFNGCQVRAAIDLYIKIKMIPHRGATIGRLIESASTFTGKKYKNNAAGWAEAYADMVAWVNKTKTEMGIPLERAK